ncbi:thiamine-phosphate kinase [Anatilimnocola floriformis]|uniref:thiamine-phosphate kinase n=1 Tax=Anatilimnocola floriformis TaxID=2948575 RepID=UPI0020C2F305|nr:thiamine-phosphate kinase [Anatilimnocola floriformis]
MELEFLRWLRERIPAATNIPLGVGDDAALLAQQTGQQTVVTTDMLMDGTDFLLNECGAAAAGRKALAVNLSDLAAMGAKPVAAFVSIAVSKKDGAEQALAMAKGIFEGLLPLAEELGCAIAGGDTNSWSGPLVISVTALGEVPVGKAWLRSGAEPGDAVLVTGQFGRSIEGRHLTFTPRVREALLLQQLSAEIHAAIDVSDGLSLDLSRICSASGCGALLELAHIPLTLATTEHCGEDLAAAWRHALTDGEDFELILAVPPREADRLLREQPLGVQLTQIGTFTAEPGLKQQLPSGEVLPLEPRGYEH